MRKMTIKRRLGKLVALLAGSLYFAGNIALPVMAASLPASEIKALNDYANWVACTNQSDQSGSSSGTFSGTPSGGVSFMDSQSSDTGNQTTFDDDGIDPSPTGSQYHQGQTSYADGRLGALHTNYIALNPGWSAANGIVLGDIAALTYQGKTIFAVYGDNHVGNTPHAEISVKADITLMGITDPAKADNLHGVKYTIYPNTHQLLNGSVDQGKIDQIGQQVAGVGGVSDPSAALNGGGSSSGCCPPSSSNTGVGGGGGGPVYLLGDSILQGAFYDQPQYLKDNLKGLDASADASVSRSMVSAGNGSPGSLPGAHQDGQQAIESDLNFFKKQNILPNTVVIELGTNSSGSASTFKTQATKVINSVKSIDPAAQIYWVNIFSKGSASSYADAYNKVINDLADQQNINLIDAVNASISLSPDNVHPDLAGYRTLSDYITTAIQGGNAHVNATIDNANGCCPPAGANGPTGANIDEQAGQKAAQTASTGNTKVGLALYDSNGKRIAGFSDSTQNYGASITKSMLLVAYLKQVGSGKLSAQATSELTSMIENSDNAAANWVYSHLNGGSSAVKSVASDAGMTDFRLDTSDQVYVLGQSKITAGDFAKFFAKIDDMVPNSQQDFAKKVLSNITPHAGLLDAGLPGTVLSKEGWKSESSGLAGAPYVVNQAGQFIAGGVKYGVAVTVGGTADEASGEAIIKLVVGALVKAGSPSSGSTQGNAGGGACECGSGLFANGSISPQVGFGMSSQVKARFQAIMVAAGQKFHVNPNFVATFYYIEDGLAGGDSTNNADSASGTPRTGDGRWLEPPPPYGHGPPYPAPNSFTATGPFQFINSSWTQYGQDGNGDGKKSVTDLTDAAFAAANLLSQSGAGHDTTNDANLRRAAFSYNHSSTYAQSALNTFHYLLSKGSSPVNGSTGSGGTCPQTGADCNNGGAQVTGDAKILCFAKQYKGIYYHLGGGHIGYDAFRKQCPVSSIPSAAKSSTAGNPGPCATDCSGLVYMALDEAFNQKFDGTVGQDAAGTMSDGSWKKISVSSAQAGDIVTRPDHVEIVDHISGGTVFTFGSHHTGTQTGPTTTSTSYWSSAWHWTGPGSSG